jgi:alpha-N-arabinofuranosidase
MKMSEHLLLHHDDVKAVNTEEQPDNVVPVSIPVTPAEGERAQIVLPPLSWNVLRFSKE